MATIKGRENICRKACASLMDQVASNVYLHNKPVIGREDDSRKFNIPRVYDGYMFTADDDLIYPPDYIETMVRAIEKYERKAVVTLHGGCVKPPIDSYYWGGRHPVYHCLHTVKEDHRVHIGGSGVMAWHTDTIRFDWPDDFPHENMADILASVKCNALNVPIYVIAHKSGWLKYQDTRDVTICERYKHKEGDELQTRIVNKTNWLQWQNT